MKASTTTKRSSSSSNGSINSSSGSSIISWPDISCKPALSAHQLKDIHLFTVPNFLTTAEAEAFIKQAEASGFLHQGSLGPAKGEAFRDNDRLAVQDPVLAEKLWKAGLCSLFADVKVGEKLAVGLNPNIRFYRYVEGQRFGKHIDESVSLGGGKTTEFTLLIYLNGGLKLKGKKGSSTGPVLVGGETVFYAHHNKVVAEVAPVAGMALFHRHGNQCMLHEARVVSKGVKYILRSDVVFA